jgi:hypothetical protein
VPRYFGAIGFVVATEVRDGVWEDVVTEVQYRGDVLRNTVKQTEGVKVNNDILVGHTLSIVSDLYADSHFYAMRYATWQGKRWIIQEVEIQRPRLVLRLGGLYVGPAYVPPSSP